MQVGCDCFAMFMTVMTVYGHNSSTHKLSINAMLDVPQTAETVYESFAFGKHCLADYLNLVKVKVFEIL